jgi:hypothetical protein
MKKLTFILLLTMILVFSTFLSHATTVNYLPRDGEIGSVNDYRNLYAAQIFDAQPGLLETLTFDMKYQTGSQSANDIPGNDLQFRVILAETQQVAGGSWQPNNIIFQSTSMTLPGIPENWVQYTINFGGVDLADSTKYAFVIDTFSDADNIYSKALFGRSLLTGGYSGTDFLYASYGYSNAILIGTDIESHWQQNGWTTITPGPSYAGIAYRMEYTTVPEPVTMLLLGLGLIGIASARRKFKK